MRTAASYLAALSQADADARARRAMLDEPDPALSLRSDDTSTLDSRLMFSSDDSDDTSTTSDDFERPSVPPTSAQQFTTKHSEFGWCSNKLYRHVSKHDPNTRIIHDDDEDPPYYILLPTYFSYILLIVMGHMRDFLGKRFNPKSFKHLIPRDVSPVSHRRLALTFAPHRVTQH